jgi:hypothetical protein
MFLSSGILSTRLQFIGLIRTHGSSWSHYECNIAHSHSVKKQPPAGLFVHWCNALIRAVITNFPSTQTQPMLEDRLEIDKIVNTTLKNLVVKL